MRVGEPARLTVFAAGVLFLVSGTHDLLTGGGWTALLGIVGGGLWIVSTVFHLPPFTRKPDETEDPRRQ